MSSTERKRYPAGRLSTVRILAAAGIYFTLTARSAEGLQSTSVGSSALSSLGSVLDSVGVINSVSSTPQLTPDQWLIISSPLERKVVYTEMANFQSSYGRTYALVDSGLVQPKGIAFDRQRGYLYVADPGALTIYQYRVIVETTNTANGEDTYRLVTTGKRVTLVQNTNASWVTVVPPNGTVVYADEARNTINKITSETIDALGDGVMEATSLQTVTQSAQEAQASQVNTMALLGSAVRSPISTMGKILQLYDGTVGGNVANPGGVWSDGRKIFWANGAATSGGTGMLMQGQVNPSLPYNVGNSTANLANFPVNVLTYGPQDTAGTVLPGTPTGVTKSHNMVFFSYKQSGVGGVYGMGEKGGLMYNFGNSLSDPQGLFWDGDQTVYVADSAASTVYSFPVGRLMENVPLTQAVNFNGAYGLALIAKSDPAFHLNANEASAMSVRHSWVLSAVLALLMSSFLSFD